jgi:hypothetical protein
MPERIHHYYGYDGETELPDEGIADFNGQPHYFWLRQSIEPCTGLFDLAPADPELLVWAAETEAVWHHWDVEYHAGLVELDTHPMRPGNNPRFIELMEKIQNRARALSASSRKGVGVVRVSPAFLEHSRQFAGQKWPIPGMYSANLGVIWRVQHEA